MALTRNKHYLDNVGLNRLWGKITALVQSAVSTLTTLINSKVSKSGDTMTGVLQIGDGTESTNPTIDFKSVDGEIWQIKRGTSGNKFGVYDTYWDNWMLHFNRDELKIVADQFLELERSGQIAAGDYCAVDGDTVNAALAGKASISHTHTSSDVTDLSSTIDNKINALDVSDTATTGEIITAVSETNGKITVTRKGYDAYVKDTRDVQDIAEILTTFHSGPSSNTPLIYRRPATALWNYIKGKADVEYMKVSPASIELRPGSSSAGNGGFIDFHYNGSTADYTSRIIESANGKLEFKTTQMLFNGSTRLISALYIAGTGYTVSENDGYSIYRVSGLSNGGTSSTKFVCPELDINLSFGREITIYCEGTGYRNIYYRGLDYFDGSVSEMIYTIRAGRYVKLMYGSGYWLVPGDQVG